MFVEAAKAHGMDAEIAPKLEGWLKDAGFVNVQVKIHKPAVGTWPIDKKEKEIGAWNQLMLETGLSGIYMRLLWTQMGKVLVAEKEQAKLMNDFRWTQQEVTVFVTKCKQAYKEHKWKLFRMV